MHDHVSKRWALFVDDPYQSTGVYVDDLYQLIQSPPACILSDFSFLCSGKEEDENMVIDVLSHESEDDNSSTTSGSDGGCTSTSHKYELAVWQDVATSLQATFTYRR